MVQTFGSKITIVRLNADFRSPDYFYGFLHLLHPLHARESRSKLFSAGFCCIQAVSHLVRSGRSAPGGRCSLGTESWSVKLCTKTGACLRAVYTSGGRFPSPLYFSYRNRSGREILNPFSSFLKSSGLIVCLFCGTIDRTLIRISADFSIVCIRPNVRSKVSPEQNIP